MRGDKNIAKYVERIKASIGVIKPYGGDIKEETVVRYSELFFLSMQLEFLIFKR